MARVIKYERCPRCASVGRDNRGDNLVRYADGGAHCFSCRYHIWPAGSNLRQHFLKEQNGGDVRAKDKAILPYDFTRDVPVGALQWLLQYGLPLGYWREAIGFSPNEERLVFRVGDTIIGNDGRLYRANSHLQFSIGRLMRGLGGGGEDLSSNGAGLLSVGTKRQNKWYVWGDCHRHAEVLSPGEGQRSDSVVLVEDLISAHKCAAAGITSVPLFGTAIHKPVLYFLLNDDRRVHLWLDKDQELAVKKKALWLQDLLQKPVNVVITDQDPKLLTFKQIKEHVV